MKTVSWTISDGRTAEVTISLRTSRTVNADGHRVEVDDCEIITTVALGGTVIGCDIDRVDGHPIVVASCGRLGIVAEQYEQIQAAIAEVKTDPVWRAKEAREAEAIASAIEYEQHAASMRRVMGE